MEPTTNTNEKTDFNSFLFNKLQLKEDEAQTIQKEIKKIKKYFPSEVVIDLNLSRVDSSLFWTEVSINFGNEHFVSSAISSDISKLMTKIAKEALKQSLRWRKQLGRLNLDQYDKDLGATYYQ